MSKHLAALLAVFAVAASALSLLAQNFTAALFTDSGTSTNVIDSGTLGTPAPSASASGAVITTSWGDNSTLAGNANGSYTIARASLSGSCALSTYGTDLATITPAASMSYADTVPSSGTYCYRVAALMGTNWTSAYGYASAAGTVGPTNNTILIASATVLQRTIVGTPSDINIVNGGGTNNFGSTPAASASGAVATASNSGSWTLNLVLNLDNPKNNSTTVSVTIWWQNATCTTGTIPSAQIFATSSALAVPQATVNLQGVSLTVPATGAVFTRNFVSSDRLCVRIVNPSTSGNSNITLMLNQASSSGVTGIKSGVTGPMSFAP